MLFTFNKPDAANQWQTINDGVMGGVSDGQCKVSDEKTMVFFGTLSLENNGGFASVRSRPAIVKLKSGDSIAARVRGDGREYTFNLYVPRGLCRSAERPIRAQLKGATTWKKEVDGWAGLGLRVSLFQVGCLDSPLPIVGWQGTFARGP